MRKQRLFYWYLYYMYSFKEKQYFRQWWLWLLMSISIVVMILSIYYSKESFSTWDSLIGISVLLLVSLMIFFMNLGTEINETGIYYRFFPFVRGHKLWEEIDQAYVRKYNPIGEYGGWGIKGGFGKGRAYNVSGNIGLQLVLKNGKKLLLGTQKPEEVKEVLERMQKEGKIHLAATEIEQKRKF